MKKQLLKEVAELIMNHPHKIFMDEWLMGGDYSRDLWKKADACGCIAAFVCADYLRWNVSSGNILPRSTTRLDLSDDEALRLFYLQGWPDEFRNRLDKEKPGTVNYATVVYERIHHFIETEGRE